VIYAIALQVVTTHEQIGVLGTGWRFIASYAAGSWWVRPSPSW